MNTDVCFQVIRLCHIGTASWAFVWVIADDDFVSVQDIVAGRTFPCKRKVLQFGCARWAVGFTFHVVSRIPASSADIVTVLGVCFGNLATAVTVLGPFVVGLG